MKAQVITLILFLFLTLNSSAQNTVEDICEKHLSALGGVKKLKELKTLLLDQQLLMNNGEFPQKVFIAANKGIYTETSIPGKSLIVSVKDGKGWQINPYLTGTDDPKVLSEAETKVYMYQTDLNGPLVDYSDKGISVKFIGKESVDGQEVYHLDIIYKSGYKTSLFISTKTYYTIKMADQYRETTYSNYKKVAGYVFPFTTEIKSKQGEIVINVFKVTPNGQIKDSIFDFPKN